MKTTRLDRTGLHHLHIAAAEVPDPRAKLLLIHGYGEYSGRYEHFATHCNNAGISLYTFDLLGHGHSGGVRAYIPATDPILDDIDAVRAHYHLGAETIIMGHSMGGLFAVAYCLDKRRAPAKALITSAAALEVDKDMSPLLQKLAPIIAMILPKLKTTPLDITYLTRSEDNLKAYTSDPLVYRDGIRAKTGALTLSLIKEVNLKFNQLTLPILAMHGSADRVTMPGGTKQLHAAALSTDKTLKIYDGLYHELLMEPEQKDIMNDITKWILSKI